MKNIKNIFAKCYFMDFISLKIFFFLYMFVFFIRDKVIFLHIIDESKYFCFLKRKAKVKLSKKNLRESNEYAKYLFDYFLNICPSRFIGRFKCLLLIPLANNFSYNDSILFTFVFFFFYFLPRSHSLSPHTHTHTLRG